MYRNKITKKAVALSDCLIFYASLLVSGVDSLGIIAAMMKIKTANTTETIAPSWKSNGTASTELTT